MHRLPDNENAQFQNDLTMEWKVSKASRYTAMIPPLMEEPSGSYYLTNRRCEFYFIVSY